MEQKNNNSIGNILIVIIIILVTGVVFSGGFYILVTQNKMARLEKEKGKQGNNEVENMASIESVQPLSGSNKKKEENSVSTSNSRQNSYTASYETEMLNRMASIENELNYYTVDNTSSCSEYVNYRVALHNKWDDELTKIYKLLMSKYPDSQKKTLKSEEIEWIKGRQRTMDRIRNEMAGCEAESMVENGEIETIKARAIELAERYDKLN